MAQATQVIKEFVDAFVAAWPGRDAARVAALFAADANYHNGPLPPVHGRAAIQETLAEFMSLGGEVKVDMLNVLADDRIVMTERVDHFIVGDRTFSLPVMGIFEIADAKIAEWRDYFDIAQLSALLEATE